MPVDQTPNTLAYLIAGYAVLFGLPLLYVISWLLRQRNLERDIELIQAIGKDQR